MFGERNKFNKISIIFTVTATLLFFALFVFLFNLNNILSSVQQNMVGDFKMELEDLLVENPEDYESFSNLVEGYKTEFIVIENEKLIYSSVGVSDIEYVDNLFSQGYIYKSIYEYGDYTIWVNMYESSIIDYVNIAIISTIVVLLLFMFIVLRLQHTFFKKISNPLIQLSYLINQMRKKKELENDESLDNVARELVLVASDLSLNLKNAKTMYNDIEKEYETQHGLANEQVEHLKTALHEVKNPLLAIKTSTFILGDSPTLSDSDKQSVDDIELSAIRAQSYIVKTLDTVINNISDIYNKIEKVSVREIVLEVCEDSKVYSQNKNLDIVIDGEDLVIDSNKLKLTQVISNLIHNAFIYSPNSSKVRITIFEGNLKIQNKVKKEHDHGNGFGLKRVIAIANELGIEVNSAEQNDRYEVSIDF